jgi:hypothetical protein
VLPVDEAGNPGVAPPTAIASPVSSDRLAPGNQGGVFDTAGDQSSRLGGYEDDCRAAQQAGMTARDSMLGQYQGQALPLGGHIGDAMNVPPARDDSLPPQAAVDGYPWEGDQPKPPEVGFYHGNQPA